MPGLNSKSTSITNFKLAFLFPDCLIRSPCNSSKSPSIYLSNFGWQYHRKKRSGSLGGSDLIIFLLPVTGCQLPVTGDRRLVTFYSDATPFLMSPFSVITPKTLYNCLWFA